MDEKSRQERVLVPAIDREIITYQYGQGAKKVLLVHGWSGRGTQLAVIAEHLKNAGYSVISFDAPAHGKAAGKTSMMPYFIESIHLLEERFGPFEAVIGHSLGGMSALRAVAEGLKTQRLVVIGTANNIGDIVRDFAQNLRIGTKAAKLMKTYFDRKFQEDMNNYSAEVAARKVKIPTLLIHDENDVDVPVGAAYELADALDQVELMITRRLGHRRILGDKKVVDKILSFLSV